MSNLLRLFFLLMIVMAVVSMVRGVLAPTKSTRQATPGSKPARPTRSGKLFQDPVCGTYVTSSSSPTAQHEGETVYFCSDECMEKFRASAS